ncbi:hypothetical protein CYY_002350 [Polysphondylium violaceum]|uniref:UDENN domain-containing protein n=1 Tax=Polysphondylium violaceum TaxID=133409 RepID=A0A8J4Q1R9_9MYCE|nr:hypothetical protein CYY_002350 [Polysphondylium violaceum]
MDESLINSNSNIEEQQQVVNLQQQQQDKEEFTEDLSTDTLSRNDSISSIDTNSSSAPLSPVNNSVDNTNNSNSQQQQQLHNSITTLTVEITDKITPATTSPIQITEDMIASPPTMSEIIDENSTNINLQSLQISEEVKEDELINIQKQEQQEQQQVEEEEKEQQQPTTPPQEIINIPKLFEHFIVVGLPADSNPRIGFIHKPELLFSYPPDKEVPPKVTEFCFPNGIIPYIIKRTPSCSNLNEVLFGQPHLHTSNHFYTFVLSGQEPLYGICVSKPELLVTTPNFFSNQPKTLDKLPHYISTTRCYCFLSKVPIFQIHFDVLLYILAQDRLITITRELSSAEDEIIKSEQEMKKEKEKELQQQQQEQQQQHPVETPETTKEKDQSKEEQENNVDDKDKNNDDKEGGIVPKQDDYKHLVDKQNLLEILKYYYSQSIGSPGSSYEFMFPGEVNLRKYNIPNGRNKNEVNSKSISEWAISGAFLNLTLENILKILGAVLLEQRVVFVCENLSTLSSVCFSMVSFIHPFIWQGLFMPILPLALVDYLEAPVPFIAGVQVLRKKNFEGLIVDISNNKIIYNGCHPPPLIPEFLKLFGNLQNYNQLLSQNKNFNPIKNTPKQMESIQNIFNTIQQYIWWLVKKIESQFLQCKIDDSLDIEKHKLKFLSSVSEHNKDFVKMLLDTQHFSYFLHEVVLPIQIQKQKQQEQQDQKEQQLK